MKIGELFQRPIARRVNPVVKVEDRDELEVLSEINEYVVTDEISRNFVNIIDKHYLDKETTDTAIWISGFFGSGKSLFLKLLCMVLAHDTVAGESVIGKLANSSDDPDFKRALKAVGSGKPAMVISMHMKSEAFGNSGIVDMLWRKVHEAFGYARTPWVAEMERSLKRSGLLQAFEERVFRNESRPWKELRNDGLLKGSVLARSLAEVDSRYADVKSAEQAIADVREAVKELQTPLDFTKRCLELLNENPAFYRIVFGLDEMGQFAADSSDLLLELASIVEKFSSMGRGKLWLAATAQERLDAVVANFADVKDLVAKIRDRFPRDLRVELTNANAEEVVRERLLRKSSEKRQFLSDFLKPYDPWLRTEPFFKGLKRDYSAPTLEAVVESYPFLPAHFQIITDFMQGLARDTGGTADKTARGPRALIAVTQDIAKSLADCDVGDLVRADHIYTHMRGSIPSEDTDAVRELDRAPAKPTDCGRVLESTYVLDQIGVDLLPANVENIYRSLLGRVGGGGTAFMKTVTDSLTFLVEKLFVREVGSGDSLTYRFLKPYQKKIEEEVRLQNPLAQPIHDKAREIVRQSIKQLVSTNKASFQGVRIFTLGFPIDDEFIAGEPDIIVNVYSPMKQDVSVDDVRQRSVAEHQAFWIMAETPQFYEEVRALVATGDVLSHRLSKATTAEERLQIQRAQEDANTREERLLARTIDTLRKGTIYVEGIELPVTAQPGDSIVGEVVDRLYPGLARAPIGVTERDLDSVFAPVRPTSGALCDLDLLVNGQFSDSSELAKAALAAVENLSFRGGASGDRIIDDLKKPPYGYADMQTRLAISVLCAQGKLKAIAPGGAVVTIGSGLEQRLRITNDFRKTVFEKEIAVDPIELQAVTALLQQRFERKVTPDLPIVAATVRSVLDTLTSKITQIEALVRSDIPQVVTYLAPLKAAIAGVGAARGNAAIIGAVASHLATFETWQTTIKPLEQQLGADAVDDIVQARTLASQPAVVTLARGEVERLQSLVDGPHPWQDLKEIQQTRSRLAALVQNKLGDLHAALDQRVAEMENQIKATAARLGSDPAATAKALGEATSLRCANCVVGRSGTCKTCGGGLTELKDRLFATDARLAEILAHLAAPERSPEEPPGDGPRANSALSLRAVMILPRVIASRAEVDEFLRDLKSALERMVDEHGSATIVP